MKYKSNEHRQIQAHTQASHCLVGIPVELTTFPRSQLEHPRESCVHVTTVCVCVCVCVRTQCVRT